MHAPCTSARTAKELYRQANRVCRRAVRGHTAFSAVILVNILLNFIRLQLHHLQALSPVDACLHMCAQCHKGDGIVSLVLHTLYIA